ncbi:hypothetical protein [Parafrankia discariae]|uniref:hypothetical protein n=1 Tax=Parafrankia discariae TaxID=365528 RepID=UPI0003756DFE|nr:hypothetical protein [Parafrankia discariae]
MSDADSVVVTAASSRPVDAAELWAAHAAGQDGWHRVNAESRELPERVAAVAGDALATGPEPALTGCVIGSVYGSGHVAETIRARLDAGARSSLAPESFLYFNPHGMTSLLCLRHRLRGHSATLIGPGAGMQALALAGRRLRLGKDTALLCGAYEVLSPRAAEALGAPESGGWAAFLVLETEESARSRGARVLAEVGPVQRGPVTATGDVRATAALAAIADAIGGAGSMTVIGAGRPHGYTCAVAVAA